MSSQDLILRDIHLKLKEGHPDSWLWGSSSCPRLPWECWATQLYYCCFIITDFTRIRVRPTDLTVKHLTCANIMVLLCKGIPQTMAAFDQTCFLDDTDSKLVFYFHRVARGVEHGSTSMLSVFQLITLSPSNSKWLHLKVRVSRIIGPSLGLCWTLYLLVNSSIIMTVTGMKEKGNLTEYRQRVHCLVVKLSKKSCTASAICLQWCLLFGTHGVGQWLHGIAQA